MKEKIFACHELMLSRMRTLGCSSHRRRGKKKKLGFAAVAAKFIGWRPVVQNMDGQSRETFTPRPIRAAIQLRRLPSFTLLTTPTSFHINQVAAANLEDYNHHTVAVVFVMVVQA